MIQNDRAAILEAFTRGFTTMPFNNSMRIELACDMADLLLPHYIDSDMPIWKTDEEGNDTYTDTAQDLFNDIYDDMLQKIDAIIGLDYSEAEPNCSKVITVIHPTMLEESDRQNEPTDEEKLAEFDKATDDAISNREDEEITFKNLMLAMEQQQAFDRATDDAIRDKLETEGVV